MDISWSCRPSAINTPKLWIQHCRFVKQAWFPLLCQNVIATSSVSNWTFQTISVDCLFITDKYIGYFSKKRELEIWIAIISWWAYGDEEGCFFNWKTDVLPPQKMVHMLIDMVQVYVPFYHCVGSIEMPFYQVWNGIQYYDRRHLHYENRIDLLLFLLVESETGIESSLLCAKEAIMPPRTLLYSLQKQQWFFCMHTLIGTWSVFDMPDGIHWPWMAQDYVLLCFVLPVTQDQWSMIEPVWHGSRDHWDTQAPAPCQFELHG